MNQQIIRQKSGRYLVARTSLENSDESLKDEIPPCKGAYKGIIANRESSQVGTANSGRVPVYRWFVDIEDLVEFCKINGRFIFSMDFDYEEWPKIEIYDDYRE